MAIDLDGTLLTSDKKISVRVIETIKRISAAGVKVVIASARPPRTTREIYEMLELETLQINYNGALIMDPPNARKVFHQPLPAGLVRSIITMARSINAETVVNAEILDRWFTDRYEPEFVTETSRRFRPDCIGPIDQWLHEPVTKLMLSLPEMQLPAIREAMKENFGRETAMMISDKHLLQLVHPEVDKAAGLKRICDRYGFEREHVMAIGDAPNDVGMLEWAGLGVAVQNAWPSVLKAADVVVSSNDEHGVVEAITRYVQV